MKKIISNIISALFPEQWKKYAELTYWKKVKTREGKLSNDHYKFFYTTHFDLDDSFYRNKRILDIGCGPRGSLEWADMTTKRIGVDPLADQYLNMGGDKHQMEYVKSPSEEMPFDDNYFDVVCSFNSLDHVSNISQTITEIKRVTQPNGLFLLLVEINHEPTNCEPYKLTPDIVKAFKPEFECLTLNVYESAEGGLYKSIKNAATYSNPNKVDEVAWLSAKFRMIS